MKTISVNTGWQLQRFLFGEDDQADAAYAALKEAMDSSPRRQMTVSVHDDRGGEITFKVECLIAVAIEDLSEASDDLFVESAQRNARLKAKVEGQSAEFKPVPVFGVNPP